MVRPNKSADPSKAETASDGRSHLPRIDAARFLTELGLRITPATLASKAVDGSGPPFSLWGNRAVYFVPDLLAWAKERLGRAFSSTAARENQA